MLRAASLLLYSYNTPFFMALVPIVLGEGVPISSAIRCFLTSIRCLHPAEPPTKSLRTSHSQYAISTFEYARHSPIPGCTSLTGETGQ